MPAAAERSGRRWAWPLLAAILLGALGLRLWGVKQGLPYAYNSDENAHFVPRAIGMFVLGPNPEYFANPPAYTYLLHAVFAVWFGGRAGVSHAYAAHPTQVFVVARATAGVLGTAAVWLLYLVGVRLFDRAVGLLAAALMAVAFLPVFYAHLALNDVPTLAPLTLSLVGTAGVLRRGRTRDYLLAGAGLGVGCATKYTAGIVLVPLLAAAAAHYLARTPGASASRVSQSDASSAHEPASDARTPPAPGVGRNVVLGLLFAGVSALAGFLIANPYAVLDFHAFHAGITHQSSVSEEAQGKLGAGDRGGLDYYLWSFTWGLGWIPSLAALGGAFTVCWRERRLGWLLVPAPLLFLAFMGLQGRYFGRWLLPIFPIVCLLAACFALQAAAMLARLVGRVRGLGARPRRARVLRVALVILASGGVCAEGIVYSVHSGLVLSRPDTRNLAREWMVEHIPVGSHVVVEPVVPDTWSQDVGHPSTSTRNGYRWIKYSSLRSVIGAHGELDLSQTHTVNLEDYERTLSPALIAHYEQTGYCWVVSGSTQSGRAYAEPKAVPEAIAYYRALARQAEVVYRASPYAPGKGPVAFNFDWTFDYYPLAYRRPGPEMTVYRLHGGKCGS